MPNESKSIDPKPEYYLVKGLVYTWPGVGDGVYPVMEQFVDENGNVSIRQATTLPDSQEG